MNETTFNFSPIRNAGLTQGEFAHLVGVSRVTVNLWCNGKSPSKFLFEKIERVLNAITKAHDAGALPLERPKGKPKAQHLEDIRAAIASF